MEDVNISKYRASVVRDGSKPASPGFVVSEGQDPVNPPGTNNYVPYSGATANVELGEYGVESGFITLDTTPTNTPVDQGTIYWDDSRSTAALIMNGTLQHIGQDTFFYVKNSSGSNIPKGTCVRFAGTDGASGHLLISPFLANGSVPSSYFMGVTAEAIANGSFGQVMHFGELEGINTSGFTAGALLYASTTVAGGFQTTVPVAPNNIVLVAAAVNSKNNGAIIVRPQIGSNINNDEGVKITSVANLDLLQYQSGTGLWENKTLAQVIGSAYVPSTRTITINGVTQDLSANRTYNVGTVTSVGLSSATSGVTIGSTPVTTSGTITLAIATASGSQNGLLSSTDWTTFNNKQNALGYVPVPETRTITINGNTFDLSTDRSWSVGDMLLNTYQVITGAKVFGTNRLIMDGEGTAQSTSLSNTQQSNSALTSYNSFGFNGSNNIYFNKGTTANGGIFAFSNTATRTYTLKDASGTLAFTSDIPANPVGGTGTTNYLPKFTGSTTIGNSQIFDNGTNVGIGTASPNAKLEIASGVPISAEIQRWSYNNGNADFSLRLKQEVTSGLVTHVFDVVNNATTYLNNLVLTNGNIGISVTPRAWASNYKAIQISSFAAITQGGNDTYLGNNWFNDGANKYLQTSGASIYGQSNGSHFWLTATSGTAGNAISFTQAMTLTSGGNLLVGTTSDNGARLQVSGNLYISRSSNPYLTIDDTGVNSEGGILFKPSGFNSKGGLTINYSTAEQRLFVGEGGNSYFQTFYTNGSERLRITSSGNVGIGTSSPIPHNGTNALVVQGGSGSRGIMEIWDNSGAGGKAVFQQVGGDTYLGSLAKGIGSGDLYLLVNGTGTSASISTTLKANGNVLIGTTTDNGTRRLQVNGGLFATGSGNTVLITSTDNSLSLGLGYQGTFHGYLGGISSRLEAYSNNGGYVFLNASSVWVAASDVKRKRNFENYNLGLDAILGLKPKLYNMDFQKDGDEKQVGLVAQEVKKFIPKAFEENADFIGLNYNAIIVTMVKAIQEQQEIINDLKQKIQ